MKINAIAVSPTAFLHLKGPDGVPLYEGKEPVGIELYGPGSPENSRLEERITARLQKRAADNDGVDPIVPGDERRAQNAEDLADLTAGFRHLDCDGDNGKPLTGRALYLAVYGDPKYGWVNTQVVKFQRDWGKFSTGQSAT